MPARKPKEIIPKPINQTASHALINEINKIKDYARLLGWNLTNSYPTWDSETSFRLEFFAKRCAVQKIDIIAAPKVKTEKVKSQKEKVAKAKPKKKVKRFKL